MLLLVCGFLAQQLVTSRRQVDSSRELVLALARTSELMSRIQALEWQLMYGTDVDKPGADNDIDQAQAEFADRVQRLLSYHASEIDLTRLADASENYATAVRAELTFIRAGEIARAKFVDRTRVDPAYERLSEQMEHVQNLADAAAKKSVRQGNIRLTALGGIGLTVIVLLLLLDERQRFRQRVLVTEREALAYSERRFRMLTERASDVVLIVDPSATIVYASPSIAAVLGIEAAAACGKSLLELVFPDDRGSVAEHLRAARYGESSRLEFRAFLNVSEWIYLEAVVRDLTSAKEIGGVVVNLRDIDDQKRAQTQLLHTALHDNLTGLPNRLMFAERLDAALERQARTAGKCVAVLFIDIDDFKVINDSVGHQVGDLLIIEVAQRLGASLRRSDTIGRLHSSTGIVARLGGDEFTVMLDDIHDAADAVRVCERIHSAMRQPFLLGGGQFYATVSIGVAVSVAESTAEDLMRNADVAMYRAKTHGKARYAIFDAEMHERVTARLKLETDMRIGLENHEFVLYYQPIVCMQTGRILRAEALLRWKHGNTLVPPSAFIPAAEESGLIGPLGDWALRESCRQAAIWNRGAAEPVIVCVNISGKQFTQPTFMDEVMSAIGDSGVHPAWLEFEITEGVAMEDAERTRHTLGQLRAIGIQLAIDDFGTGYSSLSYLRRFAVDTLKIDRSFITDLPENPENLAIVQTIIELARVLGLETVAEGVETAEQLATLQRLGCGMAQGFLLKRPEPANAPPWPDHIRLLPGDREQSESAVIPAETIQMRMAARMGQ
jgi:diguanylate cyclase (GGDEF)-like protein/PAS domain S-box-containing protein